MEKFNSYFPFSICHFQDLPIDFICRVLMAHLTEARQFVGCALSTLLLHTDLKIQELLLISRSDYT